MTFYLKIIASGRVVIGDPPEKGETLIRAIEAPTWVAARLQVHDMEFEHRKGYGYFS